MMLKLSIIGGAAATSLRRDTQGMEIDSDAIAGGKLDVDTNDNTNKEVGNRFLGEDDEEEVVDHFTPDDDEQVVADHFTQELIQQEFQELENKIHVIEQQNAQMQQKLDEHDQILQVLGPNAARYAQMIPHTNSC